MTDEDASVFDETLWQLAQRTTELVNAMSNCAPTCLPSRALLMPQLQASNFAWMLRQVILFAEGDEIDHQYIHHALEYMLRILFGETPGAGYALPLDLHKTSLGRLIYAARARLIPPERLMRPGQVAKLLGVKRQNVYDWVADRTLSPVYLCQGELRFDRLHIEAFQAKRERCRRQRNFFRDYARR